MHRSSSSEFILDVKSSNAERTDGSNAMAGIEIKGAENASAWPRIEFRVPAVGDWKARRNVTKVLS
jgi:hypothetical protein